MKNTLPIAQVVRQPNLLVKTLAIGPTSKGTPAKIEPTQAIFPSDTLNSLTNSDRNIPNEFMTPSTTVMARKETATITHPYPPSGASYSLVSDDFCNLSELRVSLSRILISSGITCKKI